MVRLAKFNFVPERQLKERTASKPFFFCSIYGNGQIVFNSQYVEIYELNNKYVRFYADLEKKTIGLKIIEGKTSIETLDDSRLVKKTLKGVIKISIQPVLKSIGIVRGDKYTQLTIMIYKSPTVEGEIHYVTIPEKVVPYVKTKTNE